MNRPWLLAALLAASFVPFASAQVPQVPSDIAAKFLRDEGIDRYKCRIAEIGFFQKLLAAAKEDFDGCLGRVTTQEEFDGLVARAKALDEQFARFPVAKPAVPERPRGAIEPAERRRLSEVVKRAESSAAQLMPSIRFQGGVGQGDDGKVNGSGGAMFRLGVGSEKWGSVGPQAGLIWSGNGYSNRLLDKQLVDYGGSRWGREYEIYEETRRQVSGLNKFRFAGVSYQSPLIGGRVAIEAGVDIGYARLNTAPEIVRETFLRERVYGGTCYDGAGYAYGCETWETRTLGRETLARGSGQKQSGLGHTAFVAAQVSLSPAWALRAEVAKDSYKAFPEASGKTFSGGVVYNIGR